MIDFLEPPFTEREDALLSYAELRQERLVEQQWLNIELRDEIERLVAFSTVEVGQQ